MQPRAVEMSRRRRRCTAYMFALMFESASGPPRPLRVEHCWCLHVLFRLFCLVYLCDRVRDGNSDTVKIATMLEYPRYDRKIKMIVYLRFILQASSTQTDSHRAGYRATASKLELVSTSRVVQRDTQTSKSSLDFPPKFRTYYILQGVSLSLRHL